MCLLRNAQLHSLIVVLCLLTVHIVPPIARELLLIENRSVGAQKLGALIALATIVADMVRLTARLHVGVHTRRCRHGATMKIGVRHFVQYWIVDARRSRNLAKVLTLWFTRLFWRHFSIVRLRLVVGIVLWVQFVQILRIVGTAILLLV